MPLVTTKKMLQDAQADKYAVGAFNVENMEMVQAVIAAAKRQKSPVIMQTTPSTLRYADPAYFLANVAAAAAQADVPVAMHLDHGSSFDMAQKCLQTGYTSIMIDGSKLPFEENVSLTKSVVEVCHAADVPVEAELGKVGGKEDDLVGDDNNPYTDPDEAVEFVERTGCDFLAVGIGTAHGIYKGDPDVRIDVLETIDAVVDIPLVMHGTSGVPDSVVAEAVRNGICKVNYATDLRIKFTEAVRAVLEADADVFDPKKYGAPAREKVADYVAQKMEVCGSVGKA